MDARAIHYVQEYGAVEPLKVLNDLGLLGFRINHRQVVYDQGYGFCDWLAQPGGLVLKPQRVQANG